MHEINTLLNGNRVVEFGNRSAINHEHHLAAVEACYVGGGMDRSSNDLAALVYPQIKAAGTTAHRFYASYPTEEAAMEEAIINGDENVALLIDLVESYSGIEKAIALKKKYRNSGKKIAIRLDSWDIAAQTVYALKRLKEEWMLDPTQDKVIASDISSIGAIRNVEQSVRDAWFNPEEFVMYGLGGLLVAKEKTRDQLSVGYKLSDTEEGAVIKLSSDKWKQSLPGIPNIEMRKDGRYIVQEQEEAQGERLLKRVLEHGVPLFDEDDFGAIDRAHQQVIDSAAFINLPTIRSQLTETLSEEIGSRMRETMVDAYN